MNEPPILSIVTPTRGNFSEYWLEQLLQVKGAVEFVLVYPPGAAISPVGDSRVKVLTSPYKGEVMQRLIGLLNASGDYVLALDDDDFVHPDILGLTVQYFKEFPESLVLRPMVERIDYNDSENLKRHWGDIPELNSLKIARKRNAQEQDMILQEIPIAPLKNKFDFRFPIWPYIKRKDLHGAHIENFNNKIWKNIQVQQALIDLSDTMKVMGALRWVPLWSLDRLLGLFIQAKFFEEDTVVGHWMPKPAQIRYMVMSQDLKQEFRLILPADALLVKRFPNYGYFWNLFFEQFWIAVKKLGRNLVS